MLLKGGSQLGATHSHRPRGYMKALLGSALAPWGAGPSHPAMPAHSLRMRWESSVTRPQ